MEEFTSVCKNCGSDLFYNPNKACLTCKYCESNFYLPKTQKDAVIVRQYSVAFHPNVLNSALNSYKCNSCGRTYFMTTEGRSSRCPNCGNSSCSLVSEPGLCADGVVPFSIDKAEAAKKLAEYLKKNKNVPKELKTLVAEQKLMSVYIPVWNFSFNMNANYTATETLVKKDSYSNMYYSETNPISGSKSQRVLSMDECATDGEDEAFLDLFDEHDYEKIVAYIPEYACGVRVDPVTKNIHDFYEKIVEKAENDLKKKIRKELLSRKNQTYDIQIQAKARDIFFNFTYVPVYVNAFSYKGKLYKLYVSGTTGKVAGKTPKSKASFFRKLLKFLGLCGIVALMYFIFKH